MPRPAITKEAIKKNTVEAMKTLGVYKREYDPIIEIYAELSEQYKRITKKFVDSNFKCEDLTGSGGAKKSPTVATLEALRKDILAYSDRLCLNPKSIETVTTDKKEKSTLAEVLEKLA